MTHPIADAARAPASGALRRATLVTPDRRFDGTGASSNNPPTRQDQMTKLTLRLHDERLSELLGLVAKRHGISKNQLIEQLLERDLEAAAMVIEHDLSTTIEQLRRYRAHDRQAAAIDLVAAGEAEPDPMQARSVTAGTDAFGVLDAFTGA
jgi:hypothetical protein